MKLNNRNHHKNKKVEPVCPFHCLKVFALPCSVKRAMPMPHRYDYINYDFDNDFNLDLYIDTIWSKLIANS